MTLVSRGMALVALVGAALGCADGGGATGPTEEHPAIPQFAQAACAEWSCSIGDCQQDPAIYGACCTLAAGGEYPEQPKPSCDAPPGGLPSWCEAGSPQLTCINHPMEGNPYSDCSALPLTGNTGNYYSECGGEL